MAVTPLEWRHKLKARIDEALLVVEDCFFGELESGKEPEKADTTGELAVKLALLDPSELTSAFASTIYEQLESLLSVVADDCAVDVRPGDSSQESHRRRGGGLEDRGTSGKREHTCPVAIPFSVRQKYSLRDMAKRLAKQVAKFHHVDTDTSVGKSELFLRFDSNAAGSGASPGDSPGGLRDRLCAYKYRRSSLLPTSADFEAVRRDVQARLTSHPRFRQEFKAPGGGCTSWVLTAELASPQSDVDLCACLPVHGKDMQRAQARFEEAKELRSALESDFPALVAAKAREDTLSSKLERSLGALKRAKQKLQEAGSRRRVPIVPRRARKGAK